MKTNHQRQFVEKETRYVGKHKNGDRGTDSIPHLPGTKSFGEIAPLSQKSIGTMAYTHDTNNGKHGVAKNIRGAKKYVRSRIRFHENQATNKIANMVQLENE